MANEDGRLYVIEKGDEMTVVRAKGPTSALKHVMKTSYAIRAATPDDIAMYMEAGGKIEVAGQDDQAGTDPESAD